MCGLSFLLFGCLFLRIWGLLLYLLVKQVVFLPNRTFLVRFGGISGEYGRAMVRILTRRSRAKIPLARPNEFDMPPKRTKKIQLAIYRTQIRPSEHNILAISVNWYRRISWALKSGGITSRATSKGYPLNIWFLTMIYPKTNPILT